MAGIQEETPEQRKDFNWSGYYFDEEKTEEQKEISQNNRKRFDYESIDC